MMDTLVSDVDAVYDAMERLLKGVEEEAEGLPPLEPEPEPEPEPAEEAAEGEVEDEEIVMEEVMDSDDEGEGGGEEEGLLAVPEERKGDLDAYVRELRHELIAMRMQGLGVDDEAGKRLHVKGVGLLVGRVGRVLHAQGDLDGALREYAKALRVLLDTVSGEQTEQTTRHEIKLVNRSIAAVLDEPMVSEDKYRDLKEAAKLEESRHTALSDMIAEQKEEMKDVEAR